MSRILAPIVVLILLCGMIVPAAGVLPEAGTYALRENTNMAAIAFGKADSYHTAREPLPGKPAALTIRTTENLEAVNYYDLRLGSPAQTRYLLVGRTRGKWSDAVYFDADGNGIIVPEERLKTLTERIETGLAPGSEADRAELWLTRPAEPLRVILDYKRSTGTAYTRILTFDLRVTSHYLPGLAKGVNPIVTASITLTTWFVGEILAQGDRVLKAAIVDGNQNGLFNEPKDDFLLVDQDFDSRFDWAKERQALGGGLYGLGADGRKQRLVPVVAAWPRNLYLTPRELVPDPAVVEAE